MKELQKSIINNGILTKKKTFLILHVLLLISLLLSSCTIKQTNNTQLPSKFANVAIYSSKEDIRCVDLDGKNDRLLVAKDDVLKLYSKKEEFSELRLYPLCVSSDKHKLFFTKIIVQGSGNEGKNYYELFSIDVNLKNLKKLTNEELKVLRPYYSPDKNYVAFSVSNGNQSAIFTLQLSDGTFKKVTPWYDSKDIEAIPDITFSKDSKRIFFVVTSEESYNLNMLNIENGAVKTIVTEAKGIDIYGWSYDGKMLAFTITVSGMEDYDAKKELCVVKNDGSNFRILTDPFYQLLDLKWSNDSSKILFVHLGEPEAKELIPKNEFLGVVNSDGTSLKEVGGYDVIMGYWTEDSKKIVATIAEDVHPELDNGKCAIYILDVESMKPVKITPYYSNIDKLIFHPTNKDKIIFTQGAFPYINTINILNLSDKTIKTVASFDKNQNILDIVFSSDYKKYLVDVKREIIENSEIIEQSYSILIYDADTNDVIRKFDSNDSEGIMYPDWLDSDNIIFEKFRSDPQGTTGSLRSICLFSVSTGETIELNSKNLDLYDQWIVVSDGL